MVQKQNQTEKKSMDFILLITVVLLLGIGLIMLLSASSPSALAEDGNSYKYFNKQALCAAIGLARNVCYFND